MLSSVELFTLSNLFVRCQRDEIRDLLLSRLLRPGLSGSLKGPKRNLNFDPEDPSPVELSFKP